MTNKDVSKKKKKKHLKLVLNACAKFLEMQSMFVFVFFIN